LVRYSQKDSFNGAVYRAEAAGDAGLGLCNELVLMFFLSMAPKIQAMDRASFNAYPAGYALLHIDHGLWPKRQFCNVFTGSASCIPQSVLGTDAPASPTFDAQGGIDNVHGLPLPGDSRHRAEPHTGGAAIA
jgi:hypothetical protein